MGQNEALSYSASPQLLCPKLLATNQAALLPYDLDPCQNMVLTWNRRPAPGSPYPPSQSQGLPGPAPVQMACLEGPSHAHFVSFSP